MSQPAERHPVEPERRAWGPDDFEITSPDDIERSEVDEDYDDDLDDEDLDDESEEDEEDEEDEDGGEEAERADFNPSPGDNNFKQYWVYEEGRARWDTWRELVAHLVKHVPLNKAKRIASDWFHERYGFYPGDDRNRVRKGKPPRGERIGPG